MRTLMALLLATSVCILGCDSPNGTTSNSKAGQDPLMGSWTATSGVFQGQQLSGNQLGMSLTFNAESVNWQFETAEGKVTHKGDYRSRPSLSPKQIDMAEPGVIDPEVFAPGIYKIQDRTLTICMDRIRPSSFDGEFLTRLVFERRESGS